MKFWVRAVTDSVEEQLLVSATSCDELKSQLQELLRIRIASISISDFQGQVASKLANGGTDIIQVHVHKAPALENDHLAATTPQEEPLNVSPHSRMRSAGRSSNEHSPEVSISENRHSRRSSGSGAGVAALLDNSCNLEAIALKRADLMALVDSNFGNEFHDVVCGSFVRLREVGYGGLDHGGYVVAQVASVNSPVQFLVDLVHLMELRTVDVISNTAPSQEEIRAWHRSMLGANRPVPSAAYVAEKHDSIEQALRTVATMQRPTPPPSLGSTPQGNPSVSPGGLRRRATIYQLSHIINQGEGARPVVGRNIMNTNDHVSGACAVVNQGGDGSCETFVFYTRQSNARTKHKKPGDFAAALATFNADFSSMTEDRDVSVKGMVTASGPPHFWQGLYWNAAYPLTEDMIKGKSPNLPMSYVALVGRDMRALYNPPVAFSLPSVSWAGEHMASGAPHSPQLVACNNLLHLFWLVPFPTGNGVAQGVAHAVTNDPRLATWSVLTADSPAATGDVNMLFHVSSFSLQAETPPAQGSASHSTSRGLRLVVASSARAAEPTISVLQNADEVFNEARWSPLATVQTIPEGDWRSEGISGISMFEHGSHLFLMVTGEGGHHHSSVVTVPVVTGSR